MTALALALGAGLGGALVLLWSALRPSPTTVDHRRGLSGVGGRVGRAAIGASVGLVATRWPVVAVGAAFAGFFSADLLGARAARERALARTEAIASWTEMLRDTMVAAHGLEEAIEVTADIAPAAIRPEVLALAAQARRGRLGPALDDLGTALDHPVGDLVVVALRQAADGHATELAPLLAALAIAAREEAAMRQRVETGRARTRTSVRIIVGSTVGLAALVGFLNRDYLDAYATLPGQVALAVSLGCGGLAFWWLALMGRYQSPERFLAPGHPGGDGP